MRGRCGAIVHKTCLPDESGVVPGDIFFTLEDQFRGCPSSGAITQAFNFAGKRYCLSFSIPVDHAIPSRFPFSVMPTQRHRFLVLLLSLAGVVPVSAQGPRVLPAGELPKDSRLGPPRSVDGYHPFRPVSSATAWESRAAEIKNHILVGTGLWPLPENTPLNAVVHGLIDQGDYTVEKVYFESMPGHLVCGSLYRPKGKPPGPNGYPGVLCPHGHWANGRFYDAGEAKAKADIATGAERFLNAGRSPLQARCVQLARMGCVVFHYDMLGNADSKQFPDHRNGPRESMNGREPGTWGFVGFEAAARVQSNFGLQTWNSVRSLDFLLGLGGIDPDRILVTGASGGGTQTMMISAIDPRVKAAFPCVMVSTSMQGGCTCENTFYLRVGQGNIDIAALVAPRPQGMTAADDWTKELKTKGYPDLVGLYDMLGAKNAYEAHFEIQFPHNYNHVNRTHLYQFVNRHFKLGLPSPVLEEDFSLLSPQQLTVFDAEHPSPSGNAVGEPHEKSLCKWWSEDAERQMAPLLNPQTAGDADKASDVLGTAVRTMIGRGLPDAKEVNFGLKGKEKRAGYVELTGLVGNDTHGEEIPAAFLFPEQWKGRVVIWASPEGKAGLFESGTQPRAAVANLLAAGVAVMSADLFQQGEFLNPGATVTANPQLSYPGKAEKPDDRWKLSPVYYYGYNDSLFARRVHDLLTLVSFVKNNEMYQVKEIALVGQGSAGAWVAAARALAGDAVALAAVDTAGFRFDKLASEWDADFQPGIVKYGDIGGLLTLSAPHSLWLWDAEEALQNQIRSAYAARGKPGLLTVAPAAPGDREAALLDYLKQ